MQSERRSGILLHLTSLPGPYGIGDIGPEAYRFVDFLRETNQKIWQILPLTPTEKCSPYSGISAFASHPLLISLDKLVDEHLLNKEDLVIPSKYQFSDNYVKFKQVTQLKYSILKKAFENFKKKAQKNNQSLEKFLQSESYWLDDYSLFMTIKENEKNKSWSEWSEGLKYRRKNALEEVRRNEKDTIDYHIFLQYTFDQQWNELKRYAEQHGIEILGDMPVYVDYDSADVWANANIFQLDDRTLLPMAVSGFPPDDCSSEGQNWNMPIYEWNDPSKRENVFKWWIKRLKKTLQMVHVVRIDHFRGLESYWSIPVDQNHVPLKPKDGKWIKAPGVQFFQSIFQALGENLPLIVEDLGGLSKEVFDLRDQFHLTGIKILQFAFCYHPDNIYRPHNYIRNCVAYTGTHDNSTIIAWWNKYASDDEKNTLLKYIQYTHIYHTDYDGQTIDHSLIAHLNKNVNWHLIQLLMSTVANRAIIQFQDLLGLDDRSRMNDPSLGSDPEKDGPQNWTWRFTWSLLEESFKSNLKTLTYMYNRGGTNTES